MDAFRRLIERASAIDTKYQAILPYVQAARGEDAEAVFLHELETLSRNAQVHLNLKPRQVKTQDLARRFEVELDAEGGQTSILQFLDGIFTMSKLVSFERIRLSTVPGKEGVVRANVVIESVAFNI
jgi:hypothetical protein